MAVAERLSIVLILVASLDSAFGDGGSAAAPPPRPDCRLLLDCGHAHHSFAARHRPRVLAHIGIGLPGLTLRGGFSGDSGDDGEYGGGYGEGTGRGTDGRGASSRGSRSVGGEGGRGSGGREGGSKGESKGSRGGGGGERRVRGKDERRRGKEGADGKNGKPKREDRMKYMPKVVFLGQLPYTATKENVEVFFTRNGFTNLQVRLLSDKKTKRSRGIAFVQFESSDDAEKAIKMDHSLFMGRRIRIERTAAGGGNKEKRKGRVKRAKIEQDKKRREEVMNMLDRVFSERDGLLTDRELDSLSKDSVLHPSRRPSGEAGPLHAQRLELQDLDDKVIDFLCSLPPSVARRAIRAAARADAKGVENRGAWVMGMIKIRLRRAEKIAKKLRSKGGVGIPSMENHDDEAPGAGRDTGLSDESESDGTGVQGGGRTAKSRDLDDNNFYL